MNKNSFMDSSLFNYFNVYSPKDAPFMHQQLAEWKKERPLKGLKVAHHVPVVENTLLKIACLVAAGAEVTVTHPYSFCQPSEEAIKALERSGIRFIDNLSSLRNELFDVYFDCGAELYQSLGAPQIGAIELTGSGDEFYRQQALSFPVVSIDRTLTKQLETVFGCAESSCQALSLLTGIDPSTKNWLIFGFGKIGRGLAYFCKEHHAPITVVDVSAQQRTLAHDLGITTVDPNNLEKVHEAISCADIIATATGKKEIMTNYPVSWFHNKILINLGVYDEFGASFTDTQVLNNKKALNFVLKDPTPISYIDPEFYIHNSAVLILLNNQLSNQVYTIEETLDKQIIAQWCSYHSFSLERINKWFISRELFTASFG